MQGLINNKPDFRILVKGLFGMDEKRFEMVGSDKKGHSIKKKSDLRWIDYLEEIDAALDDIWYAGKRIPYEADRNKCVSSSNNDVSIIAEILLFCTTPCFEALTKSYLTLTYSSVFHLHRLLLQL